MADTPHSRASPLPQGSMVYSLKGVIRRHEERTWLTQNPLLAVVVLADRVSAVEQVVQLQAQRGVAHRLPRHGRVGHGVARHLAAVGGVGIPRADVTHPGTGAHIIGHGLAQPQVGSTVGTSTGRLPARDTAWPSTVSEKSSYLAHTMAAFACNCQAFGSCRSRLASRPVEDCWPTCCCSVVPGMLVNSFFLTM